MRIANHVDRPGNTPLVKLNSVRPNPKPAGRGQGRYLCPAAATKDRIAVRMVDTAEALRRNTKPSGTIIQALGQHRCRPGSSRQQRPTNVFVCPDKVGEDKRNACSGPTARRWSCVPAVPPEHPDSYYNVSPDRLVRGTTARGSLTSTPIPQGRKVIMRPPARIWRDTDGRSPTSWRVGAPAVAITGTGRCLRRSGGRSGCRRVDPEGSVYSGGTVRHYPGRVWRGFWPAAYDATIPDEIIAVPTPTLFDMTSAWPVRTGLLVGGSCGMAAVAALQVAEREGPDAVVVGAATRTAGAAGQRSSTTNG